MNTGRNTGETVFFVALGSPPYHLSLLLKKCISYVRKMHLNAVFLPSVSVAVELSRLLSPTKTKWGIMKSFAMNRVKEDTTTLSRNN